MPPEKDWCAALQSLKDLKKLPDNWDGEGSLSIDPAIWHAANELLFTLIGKMPPPFICPLGDGGIVFQWTLGTTHIELEFVGNDTIAILKTAETPANDHKHALDHLAPLMYQKPLK